MNNVRGPGPRPMLAAAAITKGMLCKLTAAADTVTPVTAQADIAAYVAEEDVDSGARGSFLPFTGEREHRVLISASVTRAAKLMVDTGNPGFLKTVTSGIGCAQAAESVTYAAGALALVAPAQTTT
ncbi:MAG: hypothetical protein V4726_00880 [Verrucomicrobiota bacterium]